MSVVLKNIHAQIFFLKNKHNELKLQILSCMQRDVVYIFSQITRCYNINPKIKRKQEPFVFALDRQEDDRTEMFTPLLWLWWYGTVEEGSSSTVEALRTWMEAEIRERKKIYWKCVIQHWVLTGSWSPQPPVHPDAKELPLMHWPVCTNLCVCACLIKWPLHKCQ